MASLRFLSWLSAILLLLSPLLSATPIDSSPEKRQLPVRPSISGPAAFIGGGTYPRANRLADGTLLGAYTAFANGNNIITLTRSADNGATWANIGVADQGPSAQFDKDNPYVLQLPSGRVLVAFRNHDRTSGGGYSFYRITVCYSDDNGYTWRYLSTPASDRGGPTGNWEPFMRMAADGTVQLYYSRENSGNDQDNLMRFSRDGGITWSGPLTVSGGGLGTRDGMIGIAPVSGPNLIAVFESNTNGGPFSIWSVTSANDGASWGNRQLVYRAPSGTQAQAPQVINVGGTMVASFMTDTDTPGRTAATVLTSGDGGRTWGNRLTFFPPTSVWPGLITLDNRSFLGLADSGGARAQRITLS